MKSHTSNKVHLPSAGCCWGCPCVSYSSSLWSIRREARAHGAAREEVDVVALEDGSVEPYPRELLRRRDLRVEVEIRQFAQRRLRAPRVEAISTRRSHLLGRVRLGEGAQCGVGGKARL